MWHRERTVADQAPLVDAFRRSANAITLHGMEEIEIGPELIGQKIRNAARPEWGEGQVLRVQPVRSADGTAAHRVSVQFRTGHRTLLVPPARLAAAGPEPQREAGWLTGLAQTTLDDQLHSLPKETIEVLGTPVQRMQALVPLFGLRDDPAALQRWACSQTGVTDPLSHWTRDELLAAFAAFCADRDAYFRAAAARVKQSAGDDALRAALAEIPAELRANVQAALSQPI